MPRFYAKYVARNGGKRTVRLDSVDLASLSEEIETNRKAYIIEVQKVEGRWGSASRIRISSRMLLAALDSLELMLISGVRINTAVRTLAECAPPGAARRLWTKAVLLIEENGSFGETMRYFPEVFNPAMVGVIVAHETAGHLPDGIKTVRSYVGQMHEIKRESMRGAAYPIFVCIVGAVASIVLCEFTLPRFSNMLIDIGVTKVNRVTGFFFGLSRIVVEHPGYLVSILLLPFAALGLARRPQFRPAFDRLVLRLPVLRSAVEALVMARVCVTFKALSESGVRAVEALEACELAAGNAAYSHGIGRVVAAVQENYPVGVGFEKAGIFAPEVVMAIKTGEGSLPSVFSRLATYYTTEARHRVSVALRLVEPLMLMLVLVWVFGVALAVILPVVEMLNGIH
jgi:type II secretory pathway component PulF